jgi:hypothetical protein
MFVSDNICLAIPTTFPIWTKIWRARLKTYPRRISSETSGRFNDWCGENGTIRRLKMPSRVLVEWICLGIDRCDASGCRAIYFTAFQNVFDVVGCKAGSRYTGAGYPKTTTGPMVALAARPQTSQ